MDRKFLYKKNISAIIATILFFAVTFTQTILIYETYPKLCVGLIIIEFIGIMLYLVHALKS